jgi:ABC-type polysaccharide/polyol phosphate export permease
MAKENQQEQKNSKGFDYEKMYGNFLNFTIRNLIVLFFFLIVFYAVSFLWKLNIVWILLLSFGISFGISPFLSKINWGYKLSEKYFSYLNKLGNKDNEKTL